MSAERVFGDRPAGLIGASPGAFGTVQSQATWLPVLRAPGVRRRFGPLLCAGGASKAFDPAGKLADQAVRTRLRNYVRGFIGFARTER